MLPRDVWGAAMRVRPIVTSMALVAILGGGVSLMGAPMASAATGVGDYIANCGDVGSTHYTFEGRVGDTFTLGAVNTGSFCGGFDSSPGVVSYPSSDLANSSNPWLASGLPTYYEYDQLPITITLTTPGTTTLTWEQRGGLSITVTVLPAPDAPSAGPAPAPAPAPPIPPWVQAYGIFHPDDACVTGWGSSWQPWAEPITGGWVCTRTIPSLG